VMEPIVEGNCGGAGRRGDEHGRNPLTMGALTQEVYKLCLPSNGGPHLDEEHHDASELDLTIRHVKDDRERIYLSYTM